jgi:exopolyphosphatase/guanosine-5'-triphosphate,3'-diphosphate pyrophosphatase
MVNSPVLPLAYAGIDIGTNSVLLTIARRNSQGHLVVLDERSIITRLGRGLGDEGLLDDAAVEATVAALEEFSCALIATGARARAVGTSALRRATNSGLFVKRSTKVLGVPLEILSGADEARLGYKGALSELSDLPDAPPAVVLDPGGGSTEVITEGERELSLEVGAVRLTESFISHDPPSEVELEKLVEEVRSLLEMHQPPRGHPAVFVGGTATTLAALSLELDFYDGRKVHGARVPKEKIQALRKRLSKLTIAERALIPCLPSGRADIAVAGALLVEELVDWLEVDSIVVSDRGLRFGLIMELLGES